jgi:hypothetical protein
MSTIACCGLKSCYTSKFANDGVIRPQPTLYVKPNLFVDPRVLLMPLAPSQMIPRIAHK